MEASVEPWRQPRPYSPDHLAATTGHSPLLVPIATYPRVRFSGRLDPQSHALRVAGAVAEVPERLSSMAGPRRVMCAPASWPLPPALSLLSSLSGRSP